jgi:glutamyl-tRNA(Gln) amidotransferase subunit E
LARDLLDGGAWKEEMNQQSKVAFLDIASQRAVKLGLEPADAGALQSLIESLVAERLDFVKERGMGAIGPLMGMVMAQAKGADGKEVSTILRQVITDNT